MDSFNTQSSLKIGPESYSYYSLRALARQGKENVQRLPFSLKILLENLLRKEDGVNVTKSDINALTDWNPKNTDKKEVSFTPSRVILQDFTGVPCVVDLASMRDAMEDLGGDPKKVNPLQPVDLVIDHSVQVDAFGGSDSFQRNVAIEYDRNKERYSFLRWGQEAFRNFRVVPPGTGIVHQVNLEYLGQVVFKDDRSKPKTLYPDTLIGTDSHTTMINGLGILGWGVGGIEAEAAMLGQAVSMLVPDVIGFKLHGELPDGTTATDLVLTVTQMLRKKGVVGKFVEYYGPGLTNLSLPDRATIANMSPEYGATMGYFPVDQVTLDYLESTGRPLHLVERVDAYCREQGLFRTDDTADPLFTDTLELDLGTVRPSLAGPKRPQDRILLSAAKNSFEDALPELMGSKRDNGNRPASNSARMQSEGGAGTAVAEKVAGAQADDRDVRDGSVVIAAITSCTNTSNPNVLIEAGLLAKKAVEKGLAVSKTVKTSLAPGSKVVIDYLRNAGLLEPLEKLGFYLVGYGCTTCIGNSGPLRPEVESAIKGKELVVASVLSGNRNFEGRIHPLVKANYLMSPPLVVAYALLGTMRKDLTRDPVGKDKSGKDVYLRDLWPSRSDVQAAVSVHVRTDLFKNEYGRVFEGDDQWKRISVPAGWKFKWDPKSTYIRRASFLENIPKTPVPVGPITGARILAFLGDSVTTDHISPAGSIAEESPAGQYLTSQGVTKAQFNSYGSRRGNHEVMVRGTFANIRLRNRLVPGKEGGVTRKFPEGREMRIYDAAMAYQRENKPLIVLAGKEYGSGSSRDWAAKGTKMLGVKAVIAESFERIHRSNLIMMGVLPLQFEEGETAKTLGLTGDEVFDVHGIGGKMKPGAIMDVRAVAADKKVEFKARCRVDTPKELDYYFNGGILPAVVRQMLD